MQARVGQATSSTRAVSAGSPQGSILGCFLYCVTTQQLNTDLVDLNADEMSLDGGYRGQDQEPVQHVPSFASDHLGTTAQRDEVMSSPVRIGRVSGETLQAHSTPVERGSRPATVGGWNDSDEDLSFSDAANVTPEHWDSCLGQNGAFFRRNARRIYSSEEDSVSSADSYRTAINGSANVFDFFN